MWAVGGLPGNIFMMQSDFLNRLKCDILCVGPGWENTESAEPTASNIPPLIELLSCSYREMYQSKHIKSSLSMSEKHCLPSFHSFTHPPLSCLRLSLHQCLVGMLALFQIISLSAVILESDRAAALNKQCNKRTQLRVSRILWWAQRQLCLYGYPKHEGFLSWTWAACHAAMSPSLPPSAQ